MARPSSKIKVKEPLNVFEKPLQAELKPLFKALSKAIGHTIVGKWEELGTDTVEALSAIGLSTEPGELAFLLIRRSLTKALFELVGESASQQLAEVTSDTSSVIDQMNFSIASREVYIDRKFLDRPSDLVLIADIKRLLQKWLEGHGIPKPRAAAIAERLPSYFVYELNQEWRRNAKSYRPLLEAMDTPFAKAGDREWAWIAYSALLQRRIEEGIFDEPFSLSQIFVPLNAYYLEEAVKKDASEQLSRSDRRRRRVVVSLERELERWLQNSDPQDTIRVISGGPGSGKSSFARIIAARLARDLRSKVLFVPLHLIDPSKELVEEVGRFVKDEGVLIQNPLDPESPEPNLLIIFDGLDELSSQGKAAAETARAFVREVERTMEKRNLQSVKLRVLMSGRELVVQENESEFRRSRQILTLLPYFVPRSSKDEKLPVRFGEDEEYHDPDSLLKVDLREQWWKKYGAMTGKGYDGLPRELRRPDLDEITAQPLLNYLVALSFSRDKLDFTKGISLNSIYADLVAAVHERGYERHRPYAPIRHMKPAEFSRVLEEIGVAAWHGDGRTTTVKEIEGHCRSSGLGTLLDTFQEGAKTGVTRLLAAFFFRQYGQRASGDPTFVFTHKSFGEYLAARRVVRAIEKVVRELDRRMESPDEGWDERDALKHWAQICGPSPISEYLHVFMVNEMRLHSASQLIPWQETLAKLFSYMLRHGMPMEQLHLASYKDTLFQSRNAEEGLLVALNACARVTEQICAVDTPDPAIFGAWFKRIQGQRTGPDSALASECMSFLDLNEAFLDIGDFYGANLQSTNLRGAKCHFTCFGGANLSNADLRKSAMPGADFSGANLKGADLSGANLRDVNFRRANLEGAKFQRAMLGGANFDGAKLTRSNFKRANLGGARLSRAFIEGANFDGAELDSVHLRKIGNK